MKNIMVCIINSETGNRFSRMKIATPSMIKSLTDSIPKLQECFKTKFKVQRFLVTPRGLKKI